MPDANRFGEDTGCHRGAVTHTKVSMSDVVLPARRCPKCNCSCPRGIIGSVVLDRMWSCSEALDMQADEKFVKGSRAVLQDVRAEVSKWTTVLRTLPKRVTMTCVRPIPSPHSNPFSPETPAAGLGLATVNGPASVQVPCSAKQKKRCILSETTDTCTRLLLQWEREKAAIAACPKRNLSIEQRQAMQQRQATVERAHERLLLLQDAMEVLRGDVAISKEAALDLNDRVFARVARSFCATIAQVLPELEFRVDISGQRAVDGVSVRFRKGKDLTRASQPRESDTRNGAGWSTNLAELSGGQRSLCSIAFLLAATTAGVSPSLMLVDEIDAALDGVNQTMVGIMLQNCSREHGCQVWAVSHSSSFHGWCDSFVNVSMGAAGTIAQIAPQARCNSGNVVHKSGAKAKQLAKGTPRRSKVRKICR
jgi:ABC-type lipoprotein export system ATPase subunit